MGACAGAEGMTRLAELGEHIRNRRCQVRSAAVAGGTILFIGAAQKTGRAGGIVRGVTRPTGILSDVGISSDRRVAGSLVARQSVNARVPLR